MLENAPHLVNYALPLPLDSVLKAVSHLSRRSQRIDALAKCLMALFAYRLSNRRKTIFVFLFFFFFSPDVALTSGHNDKDQSQEFAMAVAIAGRQSKVSAFLFFLFFFSLFYFSALMIKAVSALSSTMSLSSGWQRECLRSSLEYLGSDSGPPSELPAELDPLLVGSDCCFLFLFLVLTHLEQIIIWPVSVLCRMKA